VEEQLKALEVAMQLERDGQAFYRKAAARTGSAHGRETFLSLADDEAQHLRILERQCNYVTSNQCFARLPEIGEPQSNWDEPLFPKDPALLNKAVRSDAGDADALLFAIQAENKSFELYRKMARETQDDAGRSMFRWLASVERGHFERLMLNYESVLRSGVWAD